jgi:hypothetical protein
MEEKNSNQKEEEPEPIKNPETEELKNQNIYDQYQKENIQSNEGKKDEEEYKPPQINLGPNTSEKNASSVNNNSNEKNKRHRRGKNEISDRNYRCPDCEKCYLSGPALTTHRKTKHGYGTNGEKRNRGRPKKDGLSENVQINPANKFNYFFNDEKRKPNSLDQTINTKIITVEIIKEFLEKIFNQCKTELFQDISQVENHSFYPLIIDNWDKESPFPEPECYRAINKIDEPLVKIQSYNLDELFFFYLKEFSEKTNKEYFWFMIKFIILFRECINNLRKDLLKTEHQNKLYTQIYNAETVPEICNDFFIEFMEPYNFFGLHKLELIELIQHFCYWLYSKQYTQSHLTLLDN